ncbi:MAG: DNA polymerase I [candidate division NC10 bacterium]|nr:DNA polymerase I [candidate division NC10 bacterium]
MNHRPSLYLIDGSSYIYRAFHALPPLSNSKGLPTHAVYGFTSMLLKMVREKRPEYLAIAFDSPGETARHRDYRPYKAQRPPMPDVLAVQIPYIHRVVEALRIPVLAAEGYEADDILGTIARRAEADGFSVTIVTGDKDTLQLVGPHVLVYDPVRERLYGEGEVRERFGVSPPQVPEIMGLQGDPIDNIPGVPGIGEKTAGSLVAEFGTIEGLLANLERVKRPKLRETLKEHAPLARLSRELALLKTDLPLAIDYAEIKLSEPDEAALRELFRELEFTSLLRTVTPQPDLSSKDYPLILTRGDLGALIEKVRRAGELCLDLETTGREPMRAELVGIACSYRPGQACYIPVGHRYPGASRQLPAGEVLAQLRPLLEDPGIRKYGQNLKYEIVMLERQGISPRGLAFDTMVASYLLNSTRPSHSLDNIALEHLGYRMLSYAEVVGVGKKEISFDQVEMGQAARYAGEDADITFQLVKLLGPRLQEQGLERLFYEVELPLVEVLAKIEMNGFKVDVDFLHQMSQELEGQLERIVSRIYALAGTTFNINSPKQLAEVLFERLKLPVLKRTKTGYSTDVGVLEQLALKHELPAEILNYRALAKLKSTYVDALPALTNPQTERIHTSLNQTVTATGRLSSSDPNLQNIPVRTELGRRIREAFVAEKGWLLLSADYSQIELRLLAQFSQDEALIQAFRQGEDIHARTAAEIFAITPEAVNPEMRRRAKAVNFGIIYGMSPFGLASDLGITQEEAKGYIDRYFAHYQGVKAYIERVISEARQAGYVTTVLGRRRYIPELHSTDHNLRGFGERTAINTPIQGSAADLIKVAMIQIYRRLKERGLKARMILQVHDELVFEVPVPELEEVKGLIREAMEGVMALDVPIKVDLGVGRSWAEAH